MEGGSDLNESNCACGTCPQDVIILLDSEFSDFLEPHAANYQELNPHIRIRLQKVEDGTAELQEQMLEGAKENRWDGAIFPAQNVGVLVEADALWDMSKYVRQSEELKWTQVLPFFRYQMARYSESIRMIPLDGDVLTMFYRRDLFEEYGIQVPRTWNEYIEAAKFFHGKPLGPDGTELFGSCVARIEGCANGYWTSLILSSMTQADGTASGFFLDPQTLDPLFGQAMDASLQILGEQVRYGHSDELLGECLESNYAFNEGRCALTYNWGNQLTASSSNFDIGVAPTPGSIAVLDRETGTLDRCTEDTCPYGIFYDDIGIVNHTPYSAFGGWAAGVAKGSPEGRRRAAADFFAYVSNSQQSLNDVLPNERSLFAQPYRYTHVTSSNWIEAGFDQKISTQFTSAVRGISSENSVLEMRMPLSAQFRQIVDEEITDYLDQIDFDADNSALRQQVTSRMDERIRDVIVAAEDMDVPLLDSYRRSIGFLEVNSDNINNLIDEDYRHAAWGLAGLMCITCLVVMAWIIRYRNNVVMKAFQPFLLMQSAIGLFLLAATVIPLGFDDYWFSEDVLNITCMLIPWMYVTGFVIFFSSVYCKIRKCLHIYREPSKYDVVMVEPASAMRLNLRLFCMNGVVLVVWTIVDPLKWVRTEVEGGLVLEDGTVETYGVCMGSNWGSLTFALILFFMNLLLCCIATYQAFSCRFLVLEYNEMQWLPLSLFPFFEVWVIGAPIIALVYDDPTTLFVVSSTMITASTIAAGMSVFAPKDWYIRKFKNSKDGNRKQILPRESSAGILVLKHPTVESQKQLEDLQNQFEQIHSLNTELEIEIRTLKDKFKILTSSQKYAVAQSLFLVSDTVDSHSRGHRGVEEFEPTEMSKVNDAELEAMEQFERVWKMPDEEYDEETDVGINPNLRDPHDSTSSNIGAGGGGKGVDKECAPADSSSRSMTFNSAAAKRSVEKTPGKSPSTTTNSVPASSSSRSINSDTKKGVGAAAMSPSVDSEDLSTTRDLTSLAASGALPASPESNGVSIYEDQESREMPNSPQRADPVAVSKASPPSPLADDPSRIEWFLNSCDSSEEGSEEDPEKILEITKRALAMAASANEDANDENDEKKEQEGDNSKEQTKAPSPAAEAPDEEDPSRIEWFLNNCDSPEDASDDQDPEKILEIAKKALASNPLYKQESNVDTASDPEETEDESESEGSDVIFKKKDLKDLRSMIKEDNLEALEARANVLAASLKTKLMDSHLADLSGDTGSSGGKSKDRGSPKCLNDLDISKIGSEDGDTTRNFVVMSDSILGESPAKVDASRIDMSDDRLLFSNTREESFDDDSRSSDLPAFVPSAGESSAANVVNRGDVESLPNSSPASSQKGYTTQNAGEPSQGDWRGNRQTERYDYSYSRGDDRRYPELPAGETEYDSNVPGHTKKLPAPKTLSFKDESFDDRDVSRATNKSYSLADWSAVGNTASILYDWSDSQSNSSFADSYAESVSSMEATTRASALDTPIANEIDKLVAKLDWDGVKLAATKFEKSAVDDPSILSIEEKRRKKRELEAWRTSISRSYSKSP